MASETLASERLDLLLEHLIAIMAGNFSSRLPISDECNEWDGVYTAINMTVEELGLRSTELASSEARFRAIFENAGVGAFVATPEGIFSQVNKAFAEFLDHAPAALIGRSEVSVMAPEFVDRQLSRCAAQTNRTDDRQYVRRDGTKVWGRITTTWISEHAKDGEPIVVGLVRNIDVEKHAEQELIHREALLKTVLEAAGDAIYLCDDTGQLVETNNAACRSLGYCRTELLSLNINAIGGASWQNATSGGASVVRGEHRRKSGETFPVEMSIRACELKGQSLRLTVARDVSERVASELLRNRFVKGVVAAQEEERRRISRELHDALGQRLTALSALVSTIERKTNDHSLQAHFKSLRVLAEEAIGDVAMLAQKLRPPAIDDLGFVEAIHEHAAEFYRTHQIQTDVQLRGLDRDTRLPKALELALYRITQEALTNVAKHAEAKQVSILLDRHQKSIQLIVEDDGNGFAVGDTKSCKRNNRPLGLDGIRERASLLGGEAQVETTPGEGTTIYVKIPCESAPKANSS